MTRTLLQQALGALHPQANRAFVEATKDALRSALAAPQPEPYGHVTTHTVTGQQFFYRYPSPPYLDTAKECIAVYAAPPAAPAPGDMVTVPRNHGLCTYPHCNGERPDDGGCCGRPFTSAMADAAERYWRTVGPNAHPLPAQFRWSECFREMIAAAPAPADWGTPHDVSGAPWGAPAPAVCDGGTCGLGGYCTNCPRLSAAPAVREPQYWCPETGELCGKCAKTGTCEASILQAHGIGGGGNG